MTVTASPQPAVAERADIPVENPATGHVVGHVPDMTAEIPALVARARVSQQAWAQRPAAVRAETMHALRRWVVRNRSAIVASTLAETGKTYEDALLNEVFVLADAFAHWARHGPAFLRDERVRPSGPLVLGRRFAVRRRPLGVVGVIAPWNYPLTLGVGDAIPALVAGNAVVLKPSEITPLTTRMVVEGLREAGLPEDLLLVATGRGETGAALIDHVDMVMFTGSTRTGRKVAVRAAEQLIPASLELGGKDPMIVCADADLDRAANAAASLGLLNNGQICQSIERIYVEEAVHDMFVDKLVAAVQGVRGRGEATPGPGDADVGAMTFAPQVDVVERHVADARAKGARVLTGGHRPGGPGLHYPPTVLTGVNHDMLCMREETFGPTLPVMKVRDVDEAVRLANDTSYGLAASIFTGDADKGEAIARRLETGTTAVNDALLQFLGRNAPFGGAKESGLGARHGAEGIRKYTEPQTIMVSRLRLKKDLGWFPNRRGLWRVLERVLAAYYGR